MKINKSIQIQAHIHTYIHTVQWQLVRFCWTKISLSFVNINNIVYAYILNILNIHTYMCSKYVLSTPTIFMPLTLPFESNLCNSLQPFWFDSLHSPHSPVNGNKRYFIYVQQCATKTGRKKHTFWRMVTKTLARHRRVGGVPIQRASKNSASLCV